MKPEMWSVFVLSRILPDSTDFISIKRNKEYFPFNEYVIEFPNLKLNLHKQMLFILNDYLDYYLHPMLSSSFSAILSEFKRVRINKYQMKKVKLRLMIYKRLLEDFSPQSKHKRTGI